jgi:hypothetical protein
LPFPLSLLAITFTSNRRLNCGVASFAYEVAFKAELFILCPYKDGTLGVSDDLLAMSALHSLRTDITETSHLQPAEDRYERWP